MWTSFILWQYGDYLFPMEIYIRWYIELRLSRRTLVLAGLNNIFDSNLFSSASHRSCGTKDLLEGHVLNSPHSNPLQQNPTTFSSTEIATQRRRQKNAVCASDRWTVAPPPIRCQRQHWTSALFAFCGLCRPVVKTPPFIILRWTEFKQWRQMRNWERLSCHVFITRLGFCLFVAVCLLPFETNAKQRLYTARRLLQVLVRPIVNVRRLSSDSVPRNYLLWFLSLMLWKLTTDYIFL